VGPELDDDDKDEAMGNNFKPESLKPTTLYTLTKLRSKNKNAYFCNTLMHVHFLLENN
jgi:hypothetical protein